MIPLAERQRPQSLEDVIGQEHLTGKGKLLYQAIHTGHLPSIIFWGPPGVGKTTLAQLIAKELKRPMFALSAISAGVKDIREIIQQAEATVTDQSPTPILFIDEIHRFNKSQQDALLGAVEKGILTLIGATTENPSFEVNNALLSRTQVFVLKSIAPDDLILLAKKILQKDILFQLKKTELLESDALIQLSGGDARKLCNILEIIGYSSEENLVITNKMVLEKVSKNLASYDKGGELHYDIISAFIKSIRGSDPNAALYWFARMMIAGEDPNFICRRMVLLASEDIGLANPNALLIAQAAQQASQLIGWPESRIILSEAIIYLACSPKSNSAYLAIESALESARTHPNLAVPLHLRNAVTNMMKNMDYGKNYQYGHQYKGNFIEQNYLPLEIQDLKFYTPGDNSTENKMLENLKIWWNKKY